MAQVKFAYGTKARYDALAPKDMDTLYFTTDTLQLFKGTTEYTKSTKMVSSLPAAGQVQGIIYFRMTDYTMHIWNGVEFVQLNKTTVTQIPADATNDDIPTTKAVADYVNAKVAAVEGIKGKFVTDVTYNAGVLSVAIYLRTLRVAGSKTLKLQIACKVAATGTDILTFKFRRLI